MLLEPYLGKLVVFVFTGDREVMCAPPDGTYQEIVANNTGTEDENDVDGGTRNVGRDAGLFVFLSHVFFYTVR